MIGAAYVREMAHYNRWQNNQVWDFVEVMDQDALTQDRGAFFGSILGTLNHILFGDTMWLYRLGAVVEKPTFGITDSTDITATIADWRAERIKLDQRILDWARSLDETALSQDVNWHSGATGLDYTHPIGICVTHLFNHQTHHRGQVHAMLTAAGSGAPVSDLPFMPQDA